MRLEARQWQTLLDLAATPLALAAADGRLTWVNAAWAEALREARERWPGRKLDEVRATPGFRWQVEDCEGLVLVAAHGSDAEARVAQLSEARRAATSEVAGGLSHEINNPLGVIKLKAQIVRRLSEEPTPDHARIQGMATGISQSVDRIASILAGVRNLMRDPSAEPFSEVTIAKVIEDALALCGERFRSHGVLLRLPKDDPSLCLTCRGVALSQALLALLRNAFEASEGQAERWAEIDARLVDEGRAIELAVTDSGPNLPEAVRARLFEPLFTTRRQDARAVGLGLGTARLAAAAHGGTLRLDESAPNTRFVLKIPKVRAHVGQAIPG